MSGSKYVLITPARNEEAFIEKTLQSVVAQTLTPERWVIVDDNSSDRTAETVRSYAARFPFIELVQTDPNAKRDFAAKVHAFARGYERVRHLDFDYIGNLDADLSFEPDFYERLIAKFEANPNLGVAGGIYLDKFKDEFRRNVSSNREASGCTQLFRRQCFIDIDEGYLPLANGGEDAAANVLARMSGWETAAFPELQSLHYRPAGTGSGSDLIRVRLREGRMDYHLGAHPLFAIVKSIRRIRERPFVAGALARAWGFFGPWLRREPRIVSDEFVDFLRREQMGRLKRLRTAESEKAAAPAGVRNP